MLSRRRWWVRRLDVFARVQGGNVEVCWLDGVWASEVPSQWGSSVEACGIDECCAVNDDESYLHLLPYFEWHQWQR